MEWALASRLVMNKGGLRERRLGGAPQERSSIFHGFNLLRVLCLSSKGDKSFMDFRFEARAVEFNYQQLFRKEPDKGHTP